MSLAVVALGGNALLPPRRKPSLEAQWDAMAAAAPALRRLASRHHLVITHGNGPQVGSILARSERAAPDAYPLSMDVAVAESEGEIGYVVQQVLQDRVGLRAVSLTTQVMVDPKDPALRRPTKPIGPVVDARRAQALRRQGAKVARVEGGWRRVVASPRPLAIVEAAAIERLVRGGFTVIAAGGGGVPVAHVRGRLRGVAAVVDKDHAAARLARDVRADALYLLTDVDGVHEGHGTQRERRLRTLRAARARELLAAGEFPPGSMGPKVEAALDFLSWRPKGDCRIGSLRRPFSGTRLLAR